jgi:putative addiction module component (TIGR02574 family)
MPNSSLLAQAMQLTPEQRLELIGDLWDTIANDDNSLPISDDLKAELDRRLEAHRQNPEAGSTWEEVKARLLKSR